MTLRRFGIGVGVGMALVGAGLYLVAMGPLDPPAGPVTETSPSLTDIDSKLDLVLAGQTGNGLTSGPWCIARIPEIGTSVDNLEGDLLVEGPVYVHAIVNHRINVTVFDGVGAIEGLNNSPLDSNWIGRSNHEWFSENSQGKGQLGTLVVPVEQIAQNGLGAAWNSTSPNGFFYVLYKPMQ